MVLQDAFCMKIMYFVKKKLPSLVCSGWCLEDTSPVMILPLPFFFCREISSLLGCFTAAGTKGLLKYFSSLKLCDLAEQPQP